LVYANNDYAQISKRAQLAEMCWWYAKAIWSHKLPGINLRSSVIPGSIYEVVHDRSGWKRILRRSEVGVMTDMLVYGPTQSADMNV